MAELELEIDFSGRVFFLEFVEYINFTVSHSGACLLRTPTRTSTCANAFLLCRSSRLVPTCCAQEASSSSTLSIPNGRRRLWQVQVRPAPRSVSLGPRPATPLTTACAPQGRARFTVRQQTIPGGFYAFSF